ncbi:Predicted arabinose efflux permease, MFS family [Marinactinospora thermotolerans DSM 45154]|uniref:Predicted arabinose efflux permease, MFS family n=1 Tax=Marinactinospora thermotolerans DSM 45154 TaxID=1122192 RepID=A0A1T4T6Q3_9ACTN|nr:MFS transporter [Marinactinospora thermotolerans]SKA36165.1 Predicted arabinose efflux permease, MFS family [Marinactinospora thermotolerans DSM 45154]
MSASPSPQSPTDPPAIPVDVRTRRIVAGAAAATATVEWYEYFVFGVAAALVFGSLFFPAFSPVAGVLASFATFAVGFLARPIGGILGGHLGDKYGRKPTLVWALIGMGLATTLIGLLPSFATVGVLAPIILVVLRLVQGVAVGMQWGGATLLATEYAPPGKRGLYGSLVQMGVPIGLVAAYAVYFAVSFLVSPEAFVVWGWRIPFLLGVFVLVLAWLIHRHVEETPEFRAAAATGGRRSPLRDVLRSHKVTVLLAGGSFAVNHAAFYILVTGILDYATRELGMARNAVLLVALGLSLVQLPLMPWAASISDRIGRVRVYAFGIAGLLVWAIPLFLLVDTANIWIMAAGMLGCGIFLSIMYAPQAALFAELFEPEVRFTGASLGYQISSVVGGGFAPFAMVLLLDAFGTSLAVSGYLMVLAAIALLSVWLLVRRRAHRETARPA